MKIRSVTIIAAATLTGSANLPVEAQSGPSMAETINYIVAKCNGQVLDDRVKDQRIEINSARVSVTVSHRDRCGSHTETRAEFDIRRVKLAGTKIFGEDWVDVRCIKEGAGEAACIQTNRDHPGPGFRLNGESCRPPSLVSKSVPAELLRCQDAENTARAFQLLQRYNGGPIQEYRDPFAQ